MCHPFSGDMCHLSIGPTVRPFIQNCMQRVTPWCCHVSSSEAAMCHILELPHQLYRPTMSAVRTCHMDCTNYTVIPFFACLNFRTERDIFSIRTPFDKVNIPPESRRRDRRNGIGFVAFRALSFLSIFQALSGFWIRFRIKTT
jgi:hypothetical protein